MYSSHMLLCVMPHTKRVAAVGASIWSLVLMFIHMAFIVGPFHKPLMTYLTGELKLAAVSPNVLDETVMRGQPGRTQVTLIRVRFGFSLST